MADITVTAANVQLVNATASYSRVTYGETVTQGQVVYEDSSDRKYYLADADDASKDEARGIALTPGGDGESGLVVTSGPIDVGATLTVGEIYILSATAGGIAPVGDLGNPDYVTILGVASAAGVLQLNINATGVQVPA